MLFRSITGELNIINKYDYKNDKLYYIKNNVYWFNEIMEP